MRRILLAVLLIPFVALAQSSIFFTTNYGSPNAGTPTFSPAAGTYNDTQTVTISTTPSACNSYIYWNTTGSPTSGDTHSTSASMTAGSTLYAKVIGCPNYADSGVGQAAYQFQVASLSFSPAAGTYTGTQSVTVSSPGTNGATYCTTLDNSDPAASTPGSCSAGTAGATRSVASSATLKALGTKTGYLNTSVTPSAYTINVVSGATDDFNRADVSPLAGNWTTAPGFAALNITSNEAARAGSSDNAAFWNARTFTDNQYSEITVGTGTGGAEGPACRLITTGTAKQGYIVTGTSTTRQLWKILPTEQWTQLGSTANHSALVAGDVIRLECSGTSLTVKLNGTALTGLNAVSDSGVASGAAGLYIYNSTSTANSWAGGDL